MQFSLTHDGVKSFPNTTFEIEHHLHMTYLLMALDNVTTTVRNPLIFTILSRDTKNFIIKDLHTDFNNKYD